MDYKKSVLNNPNFPRLAALGVSTVAAAAALIAQHEGTVPHVYRDPVGILTACTGHVSPELKLGQTFTAEQCHKMLLLDMEKHAAALNCIQAPLNDGQKVAFLSLAFNIGNAAFCNSTLVKMANSGNIAGACAQLSRWVYAKGQLLPGLVKRREAERKICEHGFIASSAG